MSLAPSNPMLQVPTTTELDSYKVIATVAASNPYWRKVGGQGKPEEIVATILSVMLLARELGISPMQAISGGINNIQGKFEISARLMNQLIRRHGHKLTIKTMTNEMCIIWGKRKDTGEEMEVPYHIEEAIRSGLVKEGGAWKKVPSDMLFARAISRIARRLFPDCIGGCYVEGEIQESVQGKSIENIEIPSASEMDDPKDISQAEVTLNLPLHVNKERVEKFITLCHSTSKIPIFKIKEKASKDLDGFLEAFSKWEEKNFPQEFNDGMLLEAEPIAVGQ